MPISYKEAIPGVGLEHDQELHRWTSTSLQHRWVSWIVAFIAFLNECKVGLRREPHSSW